MWIWMAALATAGPSLSDLDWAVVNDTVMGGVSSSTVEVQETLRFEGELSLESNGGFASIRSAGSALSLEGAAALRLELRGDGRTYDLTLRRDDVPLRAGSYRVQVPTSGQIEVVEVPLSAFRPTSFGRPVAGAPALDAAPERVSSVGLLLADGRPGPFSVELRSLDVVGGATPRDASHAAAVAALRKAVTLGVAAFNAGDAGACRDLYASALQGVRASAGLTAGERSIVEEALAAARQQPPREAAWTLRHAIDTVLASAP